MRLTVRWRTTLGAAAVVLVALAAGSTVLVLALRSTVQQQVETAADLRAEDVVALMRDSALVVLTEEDGEDSGVQVVGPDGSVRAASANLAPPFALPRVPVGHSREVDSLPLGPGRYLVVSRAADDGATVLVARTLEPVGEATTVVLTALAVGVPLLVLLVGATTWSVTGRALRPVEQLRREVAAISAEDLSRRVAAPDGQDEVAELGRTMNDMLARLQSSSQRQRRFVSDASHELRSPLASMRSQLETADRSALVDALLRDEQRLESLVADLLLLARTDEGVGAGRRLLDLDDVVHEQVQALRTGLVDASGVAAVQLRGDPAALERLVRNLLVNAVRHAVSRVCVSLEARGADAVLTVEDDGAGVPDADRERVFERFARLDEGRARDSGGSGLGLAVVDGVARAHGGTASVRGSRFTVTLPLGP